MFLLLKCAAFLIDNLGFSYVLLGNIQSDDIESRFGWFRQLSGANYFISVRQVLESNRKIRAISLLKFSKCTLAEIDTTIDFGKISFSVDDDADSAAEVLASKLNLNCEQTSDDVNIICYVAGACGRFTVNITKCEYCKEALLSSEEIEPLRLEVCDGDHSMLSKAATFLDSVNRGGLVKPTDVTFMLCIHCWRVFEELRNSSQLQLEFLRSANHLLVFKKFVDKVTDGEYFF